MSHCNDVNDDCTSYYIYKKIVEKLDKFITNIDAENPSKIKTSIDLEEVNFYNNDAKNPGFILGKAKLNLDDGTVSTVLDPYTYNPEKKPLNFIKKTNEKIETISVMCYQQEDKFSWGGGEYKINDTQTLFQQDFLYKLDTSISAEKQSNSQIEEEKSNSQTKKNTTLENILKKSKTIGDLINEYNNLTTVRTLFYSNTKAALKALILEHYNNVINKIKGKIEKIEANKNSRKEQENLDDEAFKNFYVPLLQQRRNEYNSKFETSAFYKEGIKKLKENYESNFQSNTIIRELKEEYERTKQSLSGGKKTRRSRKTIHAKKYKTIRKKSIFTPFLI